MPWRVSLASTWICSVPGYGVSCGGAMCASAASANALPVKASASRPRASSAKRWTCGDERRRGKNMRGLREGGNPSNLAPRAPLRIGRMAWDGGLARPRCPKHRPRAAASGCNAGALPAVRPGSSTPTQRVRREISPALTDYSSMFSRDALELAEGSALARTLSEQDLLFLVAHRRACFRVGFRPARIGALGRRAHRDRVAPAPHFGKGLEIQRRLVIRTDPRVTRHVGDGVVVTGDEGAPCEAAVQHVEQAFRFLAVALDRVRNFLGRIHAEVSVLAGHRAEAADLPEQPLQALDLAERIGRDELAGLAREVNEDRAGFEHAERCTAAHRMMIHDRRHLVVGRDGKVIGLELVALADVHRPDRVRQPGLFEEQRDLVSVGRGPVVEVDHRKIPRGRGLCVGAMCRTHIARHRSRWCRAPAAASPLLRTYPSRFNALLRMPYPK